jgi:hypothetical protein
MKTKPILSKRYRAIIAICTMWALALLVAVTLPGDSPQLNILAIATAGILLGAACALLEAVLPRTGQRRTAPEPPQTKKFVHIPTTSKFTVLIEPAGHGYIAFVSTDDTICGAGKTPVDALLDMANFIVGVRDNLADSGDDELTDRAKQHLEFLLTLAP